MIIIPQNTHTQISLQKAMSKPKLMLHHQTGTSTMLSKDIPQTYLYSSSTGGEGAPFGPRKWRQKYHVSAYNVIYILWKCLITCEQYLVAVYDAPKGLFYCFVAEGNLPTHIGPVYK